MSNERPRRLSLGLNHCETITGWSESRMVISDGSGDGPRREVILKITHPYELIFLEEQIAKIRAEWKRQLEAR